MDLIRAEYRDLLVVENPATSTPGLAFLLATTAKFGDRWQVFWRGLRANGVLVVDGWEEAYTVRFSGAAGSKGNRPIVVSYASSPPAEVIFRDPKPSEAPTGVIEDSCFRQIELAGVLRGARNEEGARQLVDYMLSKRFQEDVPLQMFVFPAREDAALPPEFERYAVVPESPLALAPEEIEENRERWIREWTDIVISLGERAWRGIAYGVPIVFLALFFAYPLAAIVERGLRGGDGSAWTSWPTPIPPSSSGSRSGRRSRRRCSRSSSRYPRRTSSAASPSAAAAWSRRWSSCRSSSPRSSSPSAFLAVLPSGLERRSAPILVAHAFFNVAVVVRIVGTFWASLDPRLSEAAATLGASPVRRLWEITVPLLAPALAAAAAIVFFFSFTSFGVVLILGGPRYATIEAEIYTQAVRLFDLRAAAVLSLVQLVCVALAVGVSLRLESRLGARGQLWAERDVLRRPRTAGEKTLVAEALAASRYSWASRWPCSLSDRSRSRTGTAWTRTGRSRAPRARCWWTRGRRSQTRFSTRARPP